MTATDLPEFNVTLKMARSTGSLADEVEHRTFTVCGPARNAKHAEAIAFGLGHGINEASGSAWKFCGGADGVTVAPAAEGHTEVEQLRAELDRVRADLAAAHNHAHRQDTEIQRLTRDGIAYANEAAELKAELKEAHAEGRKQAAGDIKRMDYQLGDDGWEWLKEKAENAGYDREAVRRRRARLDFTTATIEMAYQYGYRQAAKVARGEVAQ